MLLLGELARLLLRKLSELLLLGDQRGERAGAGIGRGRGRMRGSWDGEVGLMGGLGGVGGG